LTVGYQVGPELNVFWVVHIQHLDRGSAFRRVPDHEGASPLKVSFPRVVSGVKKWFDAAALWVDPGQVCPFMQVAAIASERQVYGIITAAMLFGLDMIDMKPE